MTETARTAHPASPVVLKTRLSRLRGDVRGQGLVEYLLALSLIAFATVAAQQTFACRVGCAFESMATQLEHILGRAKRFRRARQRNAARNAIRKTRPSFAQSHHSDEARYLRTPSSFCLCHFSQSA